MWNRHISKQKEIKTATSEITNANRLDHLVARLGIKRSEHRVEPGVYAIGNPTKDSPVFVSANYTLSFDALMSELAEIDGYILVLDTKGVNVWCAAGKGTFGTDELVHRIEVTGLADVVDFTESSTFISVVGVKKEIYRYVPIMALMFGAGVVLMIVLRIMEIIGGGF